MTRKELEDRLIDFAVMAIEISESLLKTKAGKPLVGSTGPVRYGSGFELW